ncbi:MAG TPA: hypothetical protein VGL57_00940 [Solirubrobacteraceae bacterium]|jgi:nicotinate-nucleotide--dimethylbenzimidazole phosphoribosyltransferase
MPACEVQRTLVKSPPELWAELSDPVSLARHLGEFGEIRTIRVEPETAVEWEAEAVRGAVQLKASGWGTKVTLTAIRDAPDPTTPDSCDAPPATEAVTQPEAAEQEPRIAEPEPTAAEPEPKAAGPEPKATEPDPERVEAPELKPGSAEPDLQAEPEPAPAASSRRGFFARLFRRRRSEQPSPPAATPEPAVATSEPSDALPEPAGPPSEPPDALPEPADHPSEPATATAEPAVALPEPALEQAAPTPAAQPQPQIEDRPDLSAELAQVEAAMLEQDTALLTAVLDRLGAAHHRPFSRG